VVADTLFINNSSPLVAETDPLPLPPWQTLCVTCDSSTAGSDQSTSTPPPSVSPTTALNLALLSAPAPVTLSVPALPNVGIQFGSAPSWNAVPELSSPSTTPWGSFDARKLKRVTSEPVLLQSNFPAFAQSRPFCDCSGGADSERSLPAKTTNARGRNKEIQHCCLLFTGYSSRKYIGYWSYYYWLYVSEQM
jgi:hypothetical protein